MIDMSTYLWEGLNADKTAVLYNEYVLKNSRVWDGNIPKDIIGELQIIK